VPMYIKASKISEIKELRIQRVTILSQRIHHVNSTTVASDLWHYPSMNPNLALIPKALLAALLQPR